MKQLIQNGTIVRSNEIIQADILIQDQIIKAISPSLSTSAADRLIDAADCYIFPGGVDANTRHMNLQGGTTTVIGLEAFSEPLCCDYAYHGVLPDRQDSYDSQIQQWMKKGITSFKCSLKIDNDFLKALSAIKKAGGLPIVHAENEDLIARLTDKYAKEGKQGLRYHCLSHHVIVEEEAVRRGLLLAEFVQSPLYFMNISSHNAILHITNAQKKKSPIYAETCPHYLILDETCYERTNGHQFVTSPPLRHKSHQQSLWDAVKSGFIHTIASNHTAFPGVEERLKLLFSYGYQQNKISLMQLTNLFSTAPAKLFGMYPKKGEIAVGSDADLVIFNPQFSSKVSVAQSDFNPYEGFTIKGMIDAVFLRGNCVIDKGERVGEVNGKFVFREPMIDLRLK